MRHAAIHHFVSHDGAALFYHHWPARRPSGQSLLLFHRGHEHGARMQHIVDELALPDMDVFAWDARGHGLNPGRRGYAPDFGYMVADAEAFRVHLETHHGIATENMAVIAQSVGAVIAAAWVHDYAPRLRSLVLVSPAFSVNLYVPGAVAGLKLLRKFRGDFSVNSYVTSRLLTKDAARQKSYDSDPLITRDIAVNILLQLYEVAARVSADAGVMRVPTLMMISGADYVVRKRPQRLFFGRLGAKVKHCIELPGFYHDTLGEQDRERALQPLRAFILERFAAPMWDAGAEVHADCHGSTCDEFQRLSQPLPRFTLRGVGFRLVRLIVRTAGKALADGIETGVRTGFDSGSMLDYVYRDTAHGRGPLGRMIDRLYLDAIGWRGIRARRANVTQLLARAMAMVRTRGLQVHLLDIAAGHGRYAIDAMRAAGWGVHDTCRLRDYMDLNIDAGRALIAQMGLQHCASFEQGDAFDAGSLENLAPPATVCVVSGLYELFPSNCKVLASLRGMFAGMAPGGCLIYTGQPWHPQLEFIARVLTSHRNGEQWVMRRRSQLELDELVRLAGFCKVSTIADRWGMFTVSLATKGR